MSWQWTLLKIILSWKLAQYAGKNPQIAQSEETHWPNASSKPISFQGRIQLLLRYALHDYDMNSKVTCSHIWHRKSETQSDFHHGDRKEWFQKLWCLIRWLISSEFHASGKVQEQTTSIHASVFYHQDDVKMTLRSWEIWASIKHLGSECSASVGLYTGLLEVDRDWLALIVCLIHRRKCVILTSTGTRRFTASAKCVLLEAGL